MIWPIEQIPGQSVRDLKGTEVETKSHELLSLAPVGTLKQTPCPCNVTPIGDTFSHTGYFSTLLQVIRLQAAVTMEQQFL